MRKYMDIISGLFFMFLAIALYAGTYSIRTFSDTEFGVRFLPRVVAGLMAGISLVVIWGGFKKLRESPEEGGFPITQGFLMTIGIIFLYILALPRLGFILASFGYITLQVFILSNFNRRFTLLGGGIAAVFSVGIYLVFTRYIYIMLPPGTWLNY